MNRWRTLVFIPLALLILTGCSRGTLIQVDVDLLLFAPVDELEGELDVSDATFQLPDDDGLAASELGVGSDIFGALEELTAQFAIELTSVAATDEQVSVAFHLVDGNGDPFAAAPIEESSITLEPAEVETLSFSLEISEESNSDVLALLRDGNFTLGVQLEFTAVPGSSIQYSWQEASVSIAARPAALIPGL